MEESREREREREPERQREVYVFLFCVFSRLCASVGPEREREGERQRERERERERETSLYIPQSYDAFLLNLAIEILYMRTWYPWLALYTKMIIKELKIYFLLLLCPQLIINIDSITQTKFSSFRL